MMPAANEYFSSPPFRLRQAIQLSGGKWSTGKEESYILWGGEIVPDPFKVLQPDCVKWEEQMGLEMRMEDQETVGVTQNQWSK